MKKDPAKKVLSVIIPVYNEEKFVLTLLDKVLHTKVPVSMEILIVNDGSTDRSGELCQEWIRTHKDKTGHRLIYLEKPNGGKGSAVKTGIRYSTGDVVIIQDADLEYDPADYEKCIRPILHGERRTGTGFFPPPSFSWGDCFSPGGSICCIMRI